MQRPSVQSLQFNNPNISRPQATPPAGSCQVYGKRKTVCLPVPASIAASRPARSLSCACDAAVADDQGGGEELITHQQCPYTIAFTCPAGQFPVVLALTPCAYCVRVPCSSALQRLPAPASARGSCQAHAESALVNMPLCIMCTIMVNHICTNDIMMIMLFIVLSRDVNTPMILVYMIFVHPHRYCSMARTSRHGTKDAQGLKYPRL